MFCDQCGNKIEDGAAFCAVCGAPTGAEIGGNPAAASNRKAPKGKKGRKGIIAATVAAAVVVVAAGTGCALYFTGDGYQCEKNMKLASACYEEKDYKEALEYYEEVLKLDSTVTEAYLQSAKIYIKEEAFEDAVKILEKGIKKAGRKDEDAAETLKEKLTEVYLAAADYYLDREDYAAALAVLAQGISDTGKESLENRRQEAELAMITAEKESSPVSAPTPAAPTAPPTPAATPQPMPTPMLTPTPMPGPLRVTVALPGGDKLEKGNQWYAKMTSEINEYTQMDVAWQFENSATYYDRLQLKIQAVEVADIIVGPSKMDDPNSSYILKACDEGMFWDLSPYLDRFDNLATIPAATLAACSYNGKVYAIPRSYGRLARYGFGYRKDWLDGLGMDSPATWAEFKEMLRVFTEYDPDGNGLNDTQGLVVDQWQNVWKIIFAWFGVPDTWGLDKDGNLIYYAMTDEYKEALREIRDLYSKGYINDGSVDGIPDFMDDQMGSGKVRKEYFATGKAGCMIQVLDEIRKAEFNLEAIGYGSEENPVIELAGYLDCGHGIHVLAFGGGYSGTIMISKTGNIKTEAQLLQALGFLNDLNDGVMLNLIEYGWEGLTYSIDWDGYVYDFTEEELKASGVGSKQAYSDGFDQILAHYTAEANARPVERPGVTAAIYVQENKLYKDNIPYVVVNYGAGLSSKVAADRGAELSKIIDDAQLAYIRGEIDKNGLEQALSRWKTAGGEDMTREMNDLYRASRW